MESVTALTKARNAKRLKAAKRVPRYVIKQTSVREPFVYGEMRVLKPVEMDRAMNHWLDIWQHARPSISYSDIDPCKAHWSRLNIQS